MISYTVSNLKTDIVAFLHILATMMTYQLFLACLDDTPSKVMGNFTVVSESSAIWCHVVYPVGKKRIPESDLFSRIRYNGNTFPNTFITISVT